MAVKKRNWRTVEVLLEGGADAFPKHAGQRYLFLDLALSGRPELLRLSLAQGGKPESDGAALNRALAAAAGQGDLDMVKLILPHLPSDVYADALVKAVKGGHREIARTLVESPRWRGVRGLEKVLARDWTEIAENYGCAANGIGYCRFLLTMRDIARRTRESYAGRQPRLEQYICPTGRKWIPPLAKLLDEWNWVRRTNS